MLLTSWWNKKLKITSNWNYTFQTSKEQIVAIQTVFLWLSSTHIFFLLVDVYHRDARTAASHSLNPVSPQLLCRDTGLSLLLHLQFWGAIRYCRSIQFFLLYQRHSRESEYEEAGGILNVNDSFKSFTDCLSFPSFLSLSHIFTQSEPFPQKHCQKMARSTVF